MKIFCTDCRKKISIDDAFVGGVCRCPYCRALVFVPDDTGAESGPTARPEAPTERPSSPEELQAVAESKGQQTIPTATPVKIQGIVSLVLIGVLLAMGIGAAIIYFASRPSSTKQEPEGPPSGFTDGPVVNPAVKVEGVKGAWVAGNVPIQSPILYVVDTGDSMKDLLDFARAIARYSVRGLSDKDLFNILLCQDVGEEDKFMADRYRTGPDDRSAREFLELVQCRGMSDLPRALKAAMGKQPTTIVLFTAKPVDDLMGLTKELQKQKVVMVTITLGDNPDTKKSMAALAKATGGSTRKYVMSDVINYDMPPLD